jgi:hypothetical protein
MDGIQRQYNDYATATRGELLGTWPIGGYLRFFWMDGMGPLPALAAALGIGVAVARRDRASLVLLVFVLPYVLFFLAWPEHFFRNLLPIFPPLALFAAIGIDVVVALSSAIIDRIRQGRRIWPNRRVPFVLRGLGLFALTSVVIIGPSIVSVEHDRSKYPPSPLLQAGANILYHLPRGAQAASELPGWQWSGDPAVIAVRSLTDHDVSWYRSHGFRYLVSNSKYRSDSDRQAYDRLRTAATLVRAFNIHGNSFEVLDLGVHPEAIPLVAHPVQLGDGITLFGYQRGVSWRQRMGIWSLEDTRPLHAGQWLLLNLFFQTRRRLDYDYRLVLDLEDANGNRVIQCATVIRERDYPSTRWRPGELIIGNADMQIPATLQPGIYHLRVAIERPDQEVQSPTTPTTAPGAGAPFMLADLALVP